MIEAASNISLVVEELNRCDCNKTIHWMLNVTEQNDFCSDENFMKDVTSWCAKDMCVRWWVFE